MAQACGLGLLLALLLPLVGASMPGFVVRLNKATLKYVTDVGKVPFQRVLKVTVPYFLDQSQQRIQPIRVQILNVHVHNFQLNFVADFGVHLSAEANFNFRVLRVPESVTLTMPVILSADVQVTQGPIQTPLVSISDCNSTFGPISILDGSNNTSPKMLVHLQNHIETVLNNKLCLAISSLMQVINVHFGTLIGLKPVGPESQIRYTMVNAPTITNDYISLDINAMLFLLGKPIVLPLDATPFLLLERVGAKDAMTTLGLSQDLFDSAILLLQKAGSLNLEITGKLHSVNNQLNTSVLGQLIPEVTHQFPQPMPLVLKAKLGATPIASLAHNNATLQLQPLIEVLVAASNSDFRSLFSLNVMVTLSLQLSVSKVKLQGATKVLGDIGLTVASSNVGSFDTRKVHALVRNVFEKPLLDHLNALLGLGISLPSVANLYYLAPRVLVHDGYAVISSDLFYQC
ncbi:PREDICTED: BPI fold-containing family B member 2 [Elephantulus edwardii]|uniref:BPI fold-containing family B member 2 n=1 Tax=Elephantulus edwardii TaxID=28737 RepID=UPI0003F0934D|nr:PREDICTED: BPI fold-containing family B member 2 [Elephantulus edwardii]